MEVKLTEIEKLIIDKLLDSESMDQLRIIPCKLGEFTGNVLCVEKDTVLSPLALILNENLQSKIKPDIDLYPNIKDE